MSGSSGPLSAINKIHINNSTKMTLSDRFTAFSAQPKIQPRTTRRGIDSPVSRAASIANRRLLKQLAQKHTREAALKLKRRSMKPRTPTAAYSRVSNGVPLKRGSIKALRLGPSGRLLKANSITNVATMEADFLGRAPRRSNSTSRISERIGVRRNEAPGSGGARRVGRPAWHANSQLTPPSRMRSRSRSRTRRAIAVLPPTGTHPGIGQRMARPVRSNSRPRPRALIRSRSRSARIDRLIRMMDGRGPESVPITSRLGTRPTAPPNRARSTSRGRAGGRRPLRREGIVSGRIQKRRTSVKPVTTRGASLAGSVQNRISRARGRYDLQRSAPPANSRLNAQFSKSRGNAARGRARSRSRIDNRTSQRNNGIARGGVLNRQRGALQSARGRGAGRGNGRRGRSQQRGGGVAAGAQRNGGGQQQQQQSQRRGRSRSRGRGSARGGRQLLGADKSDVKKEDLDKELDQYMSSTKTTDGQFS